jgi:hypothetical protein
MDFFDAWEQFAKQIYPQQHFEDDDDDENINLNNYFKLDYETYSPSAITACYLVEYVIYIQNYLLKKNN